MKTNPIGVEQITLNQVTTHAEPSLHRCGHPMVRGHPASNRSRGVSLRAAPENLWRTDTTISRDRCSPENLMVVSIHCYIVFLWKTNIQGKQDIATTTASTQKIYLHWLDLGLQVPFNQTEISAISSPQRHDRPCTLTKTRGPLSKPHDAGNSIPSTIYHLWMVRRTLLWWFWGWFATQTPNSLSEWLWN